MKLVHPLLSNAIQFKEDLVNVLVIEKKTVFSSFIQEMLGQWQTGEGKFVLSDNEREYSLKKVVEVIDNPFSVDINSKKIIAGVINTLQNISEWEDYFFQTKEVLCHIDSYLALLVEESSYPILVDNLEVSALLKGANVHMETETQNLLEKLVDYMKAVSEFLHINHFLFVNLCLYLDEKELDDFLLMVRYEKYQVLLLETLCPTKKENVQYTIIDTDLCEISY